MGQCTATRLRLRRSLDGARAAVSLGRSRHRFGRSSIMPQQFASQTAYPGNAMRYVSKLFHSLPITGNAFRNGMGDYALNDCKHAAKCRSALSTDICGNYDSNAAHPVQRQLTPPRRLPKKTARNFASNVTTRK